MKIYTKGGDKGHTQVAMADPARVPKNDARIAYYGALDELNAQLGLLASLAADHRTALEAIQRQVFALGFVLSANQPFDASHTQALEQSIDQMSAQLPAQTAFLLPGGCPAAAQAQVARAVARRAERDQVALAGITSISPAEQAYLNRLSDYLYILARYINHQQGSVEASL